MGLMIVFIAMLIVTLLFGFERDWEYAKDKDGHYLKGEDGLSYKKYYWSYNLWDKMEDNFFMVLGFILSILMILSFGLTFIIVQTVAIGDYNIQVMRREVIVYKLDRISDGDLNDYILNGDFGSLEDTYNDVIDFNRRIITSQTYSDNFWVDWFVNPYYKNLEPITLDPL